MIGYVENGCITPASQAEYLRKHAHLLGIIGKVKFYELDDQGYKVFIIDGIVAQVEKIKLEDAKTIIKNNLKLGGF